MIAIIALSHIWHTIAIVLTTWAVFRSYRAVRYSVLNSRAVGASAATSVWLLLRSTLLAHAKWGPYRWVPGRWFWYSLVALLLIYVINRIGWRRVAGWLAVAGLALSVYVPGAHVAINHIPGSDLLINKTATCPTGYADLGLVRKWEGNHWVEYRDCRPDAAHQPLTDDSTTTTLATDATDATTAPTDPPPATDPTSTTIAPTGDTVVVAGTYEVLPVVAGGDPLHPAVVSAANTPAVPAVLAKVPTWAALQALGNQPEQKPFYPACLEKVTGWSWDNQVQANVDLEKNGKGLWFILAVHVDPKVTDADIRAWITGEKIYPQDVVDQMAIVRKDGILNTRHSHIGGNSPCERFVDYRPQLQVVLTSPVDYEHLEMGLDATKWAAVSCGNPGSDIPPLVPPPPGTTTPTTTTTVPHGSTTTTTTIPSTTTTGPEQGKDSSHNPPVPPGVGGPGAGGGGPVGTATPRTDPPPTIPPPPAPPLPPVTAPGEAPPPTTVVAPPEPPPSIAPGTTAPPATGAPPPAQP